MRQMAEAGLAAMQSLYEAAVAIASSIPRDGSNDFLSAFDGALNSIEQSAMSRAPKRSDPEMSAKRRHLVRQLELKLSAATRDG